MSLALASPISGNCGDRAATPHLHLVPESGHIRTGKPLDGGLYGPVPNGHGRRVNRDNETDRIVVNQAIPKGSMRAAHGDQVKAKLGAIPEFIKCYRNKQRTLSNVLQALISALNFETMTTRPGWDYIAEQAGIHRATVGRSLKQLQAWGLVGVVASGRRAEHAAADKEGIFMNEAAVYVLCIPSELHGLPVEKKPSQCPVVDEFATPPAVGGVSPFVVKETHAHAKETTSQNDAASPQLQNPISGVASSAPTAHQNQRPESYWPSHRTTRSKNQRVAASAEIRKRLFPLRCLSFRDIASTCREYFQAGYTVADIIYALDTAPDGTRWPHSGAPDTKDPARIRGWMKHRLHAWRTPTGEILRSKDQRDAARTAREILLRKIEHKKLMERRAQHDAQLKAGDSPTKITALAQIRALLAKD